MEFSNVDILFLIFNFASPRCAVKTIWSINKFLLRRLFIKDTLKELYGIVITLHLYSSQARWAPIKLGGRSPWDIVVIKRVEIWREPFGRFPVFVFFSLFLFLSFFLDIPGEKVRE